MRGTIHRRAEAERDLIEIYRHYVREAGLLVADRFLTGVENSFRRLADMPGIGAPYEADHPGLTGLRVHP
jgi:plasmid stabilization system protein ParE